MPPDLDCQDVPFKRFKVLPQERLRSNHGHGGTDCNDIERVGETRMRKLLVFGALLMIALFKVSLVSAEPDTDQVIVYQ